MKIQFHFHRYDYLAFYLMMISVVNTINQYITVNTEIINHYENLDLENSLIILYLQDIKIEKIPNNAILISTEHYQNLNHEILTIINSLENKNIFIWEFSPTNIQKINKNYPNINTHYLPLLYNQYLELHYQQNIIKKIEYQDKEIDILFMGTLNERRSTILDELKKTYNVKIIIITDNLSFEEIINCIENSKIVLHIYYYEVFVFDYYRNSFLLANKVVMVSEHPYNIDTEIEANLKGYEDNLIIAKYDDIIDTVKKTLEKTPEEIDKVTTKTYEWFKNHDMRQYVYDFFTSNSLM